MKKEPVFKNINELRKDYMVVASFYDNNQNRLFADIVRIGMLEEPIDAYLVMINPGGCKEAENAVRVDSEYYKQFKVVKAVSDRAQKCIMQLMDICEMNKIRILNLSDKVEPDSKDAIKNMVKSGVEKSIFSEERKMELEKITIEDAPYIIAWGMDDKLIQFKKLAMQCLQDKKTLGIEEDKEKCSYRYIKPMNVEKQKEVITKLAECMEEELTNDK